jgi:hypothetical protein
MYVHKINAESTENT